MSRIITHFDSELGVIAAAIDSEGEIVATAAAQHKDGVYTASDEAGFFEATGQLLPVDLWETGQ